MVNCLVVKPRFIQVSCAEGNKIDLRQAKAVLRYKPDIIFLEYPGISLKPIVKPIYISKAVISKYPWVESDNFMWANVSRLWKSGYPVLVYAVDGPHDLVSETSIPPYPYNEKYPHKTTNLFWWVRIYLRECFMAKKIRTILKQYRGKKSPTVLVFLQSFHWRHVQFLLSNPSKKATRDYYFKRFRRLKIKDIYKLLQKENKILSKYWDNSANLPV